MKFFGEPGLIVNDSETNRPLFKFDENGEFDTKDFMLEFEKKLIDRIKVYFRHEEMPEAEAVVDNVTRVVETPEFKCKKCNEVFTNQGEFLAHHRTAHKKEVDSVDNSN
jgi:hypothetical protein